MAFQHSGNYPMVFQHSAWPQSRPGDINMTTPWKYEMGSTPGSRRRGARAAPTPVAAACASGLHALHFTT